MKIGLIMLAAGNSRRFCSNKLFFPIEGIPMYRRILNCLTAVRDAGTEDISGASPGVGEEENVTITVVTQYGEIAEAAEKAGARALFNFHPEKGISFSLQTGLQANLDRDACLFTVADQPWLTAGTVRKLLRLFLTSEKGIACVSHKGSAGNPCIFSAKYYAELMVLQGDVGGRAVLAVHGEDTALLEVEDGRELTDLDEKPACRF